MRSPLDEARERGAAALADARRGLSLLDGPLTEAKRTLARKRLARASEELAVVWLALGQIEAEAAFTPPPPAIAPKGGVVGSVVESIVARAAAGDRTAKLLPFRRRTP